MAEENIVRQIAALIYYDKIQAGPERKQFENLDKKDQDSYIVEAVKFFDMLDKCNKMVVKKVDLSQAQETQEKYIDRLTGIIQDFIKKCDKPKGIAKFFPSRELAMQILKGGE